MDVSAHTPSIRFPLSGTWLVLNPPGHPPHAYDISRIGPHGRLTSVSRWKIIAGRARADQVFGWGQPVAAPVNGEVVQAVDEVDDRMVLNPAVDVPASLLVRPARARGNLKLLAGNHVVIGFDGLYAVLAHLRRGSVKVNVGDRVEVGEPLAVVGNSGTRLLPIYTSM